MAIFFIKFTLEMKNKQGKKPMIVGFLLYI